MLTTQMNEHANSCTPHDIAHNPYKQDFPLLAAQPQLAYLDSAATSQRPLCVVNALQTFYTTMNANPLRGLYGLSVAATSAIDKARASVARFIGACDDAGNPLSQEIVFTRNASESLNLIAKSLGSLVLHEGDEVVISIMEHHSNLIPWQEVCKAHGAHLVYLHMNEDFRIPEEELASKITSHTKIVSVTQVSNVLGVENDIARIAEFAHKQGAYMVVDGAQSVPHMPVDVRALGCDLMAFSAHKMLGTFGIGVMWGKLDILQRMPVFLTGGEMIDSVSEQSAVWAPLPQKFEAGTQDAAGIYALGEAVRYLEAHGMDTLSAREEQLAVYLCDELAKLPFVEIYGPLEGTRHVGAVSFNIKGIHPHDVSSILDTCGVCIRAGHHCAQPLLISMGLSSTCRASLAFYNDKDDIDKLIDGLKNVWKVFHGE